MPVCELKRNKSCLEKGELNDDEEEKTVFELSERILYIMKRRRLGFDARTKFH